MKQFTVKRIIPFIIFLLVTTKFAAAQKKDPGASPQAMHDMYLEQATKKRIIGWTMVGGGTAMIIGGIAKSMSPTFKDIPKTDPKLLWLPAAGLLSTIGGVTMVLSAKKLDRKADLMLKGEGAMLIPNSNWTESYPALTVRIRL
jgi:hypothetical protein